MSGWEKEKSSLKQHVKEKGLQCVVRLQKQNKNRGLERLPRAAQPHRCACSGGYLTRCFVIKTKNPQLGWHELGLGFNSQLRLGKKN